MNIPTGSEIGICIGKGGTVLTEVAVERAREALESNAKTTVQALKHRYRQRHLRELRLAARAHPRRVPTQDAPHTRQKLLELLIVEAAVPVKALLQWNISILHNKLG